MPQLMNKSKKKTKLQGIYYQTTRPLQTGYCSPQRTHELYGIHDRQAS